MMFRLSSRLRYGLCAAVVGGGLIVGAAPASAHQFHHHQFGSWVGGEFATHDTGSNYRFEWRCSGPYHIKLVLQRDYHAIFGGSFWDDVTTLAQHSSGQGGTDGRQGEYHIETGGTSKPLYRLEVRTVPGCEWGVSYYWHG
jgi:hypothetical protein